MSIEYNFQAFPNSISNVFVYQIFPDRFSRGNNDYLLENFNFKDWEEPPNRQGYRGGDLFGVANKLDYLKNIGFNCISLNPIFSSASNHRYHTYDYFSVDPLLGGNRALDFLIEEIHKRKMFLVLDGVFNHCGRGFWPFHHLIENGLNSPYSNWFKLFQDPINPYPKNNESCGYNCWWNDPALPKFNFDNEKVQDYLISVGKHWANRGIDGWRLDVAKEIPFSFWDKFNIEMKKINPNLWVIGEIWGDARKWLDKKYFDGVMNYRIGWSTLSWVSDIKIESSYKNPSYPLRNLSSKDYIEILNKTHSWYSREVDLCNLNLLDSHDVPRALNTLKNDLKSLKLALLLLFLNRGVPCIYYGTEIGLSGGQEPGCREPFPWSNNYDFDLREFIHNLINFRKVYIDQINIGIKWTPIGEDVIMGTVNNKDIKSNNNLNIIVNRSRKKNFKISKNISKIIFGSDDFYNFNQNLNSQSFICFKDYIE